MTEYKGYESPQYELKIKHRQLSQLYSQIEQLKGEIVALERVINMLGVKEENDVHEG